MFGDFPLPGKIVVVTGGASGIGLAFGKIALSSGAKVIIADLQLPAEAEKFVEEHDDVFFTKCDVRNWAELEALVAYSQKILNDVPDVYVANAGIGEGKRSSYWNDPEEDRYAVLDINLAHPIKLSRIAIKTLHNHRKKGVVVVTSSVAGLNGHFSTPLYVASKHGTIGLIKSLALAEEETNVKVVGVCPGLVYTPLLVGIAESGGAQLSNNSAFIQPDEIASRMKDLIERGKYRGGTALGVYRPGEATIVADGSHSELEALAPSDKGEVQDILEGRK